MSETYLNGKLTVSSLATPSEADLAALAALTPEERRQVLHEALEHRANSGVSTRTIDEIWEAAKAKAKAARAPNPSDAL